MAIRENRPGDRDRDGIRSSLASATPKRFGIAVPDAYRERTPCQNDLILVLANAAVDGRTECEFASTVPFLHLDKPER